MNPNMNMNPGYSLFPRTYIVPAVCYTCVQDTSQQRYFINSSPYGVNMVHNYIPIIPHNYGEYQMVPGTRDFSQGQQIMHQHITPYVQQGPFPYHQDARAAIMQHQNMLQMYPDNHRSVPMQYQNMTQMYHVNQPGMYYPVPVQHVPMPNEPQESVSHMNRYQNFYRPTHFVQSQPMAMVSDSQCVQVPQQQPEHSHQLPSESELTSHDNNKCIDTNSSVKQFSSDIPSSDTEQCSAASLTEKKIYPKTVSLQFENEPACQKKPDVLNKWNATIKLSTPVQCDLLKKNTPETPVPKLLTPMDGAIKSNPIYLRPIDSPQNIIDQMRKAQRDNLKGKTGKSNNIRMSLPPKGDVQINQTANGWIPTAKIKATRSNTVKNVNTTELTTEQLGKQISRILNKFTPYNIQYLIAHFKELPINTIERLEKTIDLIFVKAIEKQIFAPHYANLCSAVQFLEVSSEIENRKVSFRELIIDKCQKLFELNKNKTKELQLQYKGNTQILRKHSIGNCRFIGELFKTTVISPNCVFFCITSLIKVEGKNKLQVEESLECLCNLLKTVGMKLEKTHDLNGTFVELELWTSKKMQSEIPSRIRFMIQEIIELRKNKWMSKNESE